MQLKLAKYKDGKFEKFLELGEDFLYGGNEIFLELMHNSYDPEGIFPSTIDSYCFIKDQKDPLNRFNGLFDGRTYGEGRFVLVKDEDFDVYKHKFFSQKDERYAYSLKLNGKISCKFDSSGFIGRYVMSTLPQLIGNLMENPELFLKIHGS
jgi:hypothetical protein